MPEARTVVTPSGLRLEAEVTAPDRSTRVGDAGGTMRSIVVSALFAALPAAGVRCLRFNFRGVEGSDGAWDEGRGEQDDAAAAVDALTDELPAGAPLLLAGWSFGADMALACTQPSIGGWLAIAPPLRFAPELPAVADNRPKWVVLAEHDEFRAPEEVRALTDTWRATTVAVVGGASHFFMGRTDAVVAHARTAIDALVGSGSTGSR